jgi:hypothetical protein
MHAGAGFVDFGTQGISVVAPANCNHNAFCHILLSFGVLCDNDNGGIQLDYLPLVSLNHQ